MRLLFDHTRGFGKMMQETLLYFPVGAVFEPHEKEQALHTGWFPVTADVWYQSRLTRIELGKYKPSERVLQRAAQVRWHITTPRENIIAPIYEKYIAHKGYNSAGLTVQDILDNSNRLLLYTHQNRPVGFLAYKILGHGFLSVEFAWDYVVPELSLGHVSRYAESKIAKQSGCTHIYMGAGYEICSLYKGDYPGFQWWKGYEWSEDVDSYKNLCYLDSGVQVNHFDHR